MPCLRGRLQGHRLKAVVKDLVPFERIEHDDGQADLDACQGEALSISRAEHPNGSSGC